MRLFDHERLHTYLVSVTLVAQVDALVAALPPSRRALGEQLLLAAASLPVALAVESRLPAPGGHAPFARARRDAATCAALLDVLACLDAASPDDVGDARETLLDIVAALAPAGALTVRAG